MIGSKRSLSVAVLLTMLLSSSNLVMSQSLPDDQDRIDVVRAVLEAQLARQGDTFAKRYLSTENITSLISTRVAADLHLTTLSYAEISDRAQSYSGVHYLRFNVFTIEGDRTIVRLSVVHEVTPCFAPYLKDQHDFTYKLTKMGGYWKAELIFKRPPSSMFGVEKLTFGKSL